MRSDSDWAEQLTAHLLAATDSSRTTLRLLDPWGRLHLVAESCAPGVQSMQEGPQIDPRPYATYQYLEQRRELLVQDDCRTGEPRPPETLISHHRVYAQMLAPVVVRGVFVGTISVHQQERSRRWSQAEIDALAAARREVEAAVREGSPQLSIPIAPPPPAVDATTLHARAACAGLALSEEDISYLEKALTEYLQNSAPLRAYDLVDPSISLDWNPRW